MPGLFRSIVSKAKDFLQGLIRQQDMPPKPTLDIDMAEFRIMRNMMIRVLDRARGIRSLQDNVLPKLKQQLAETKSVFKGKERKAKENRRPAEKERLRPPEKESVRNRLRQLQTEDKQKPRRRSFDRER